MICVSAVPRVSKQFAHLVRRDALLHGRFDMRSVKLAYDQIGIADLDVDKEV
jgi:hypothetical protein